MHTILSQSINHHKSCIKLQIAYNIHQIISHLTHEQILVQAEKR